MTRSQPCKSGSFLKMSMTRKGVKQPFMSSADDVIKYHSLTVYLQILYWRTLIEKDVDPTLWGWHFKDGALEPIMGRVVS